MAKNGRKAVIVGGIRTPFAKAFTTLTKLDTIALGVHATRGVLEKYDVPRDKLQAIFWGGVVLPPLVPNVGREIALDLGLTHVDGVTVSRACASGLQAITNAAAAIERGETDVAIAGGSESTSNAPVSLPPKVTQTLGPIALGGGKATWSDYVGAMAQLLPLTDIIPRAPKVAERTTGEVMGAAAERMAKRNEIAREAQDEFAVRSHQRAARAVANGRFDDEIVPVETPDGWVHSDALIRSDTTVEKLAKLRPVFAKNGTVTAGNASALTDGAGAVLMMSEEAAKALGYAPLAAIRSVSYVAVDPADQLLIGPAISMPQALERAGMSLADVDLVDIHEAFAAQVLCVLKAMASTGFAKHRLGRSEAVGEVDPERLNVHGGSLAIGHPFGATGPRMVTTMANELVAADKQTALLGICAAGGIGAAAVLERV